MVDFCGENVVNGVFLSGTTLDLDVSLHTEWCVEGNDFIAARDVKTLFSDAGADKDSFLTFPELIYLSQL